MKNIHGIAFFVIGVAVFWLGATRVTYNVDVLALLPPDLPEVKGVSASFRHFSGVNELLITVESEDSGLTEAATADLVTTLEGHPEQFSGVIWRLPLQEDPNFAAEFLAWLWLNSAPGDLDRLSTRLAPEPVDEHLEAILDDLAGGLLDAELMMRTYDPLGFTEIPGGLQSTALVADESDSEEKVDPFSSVDGTFRMVYATASSESFANYTEVVQWLNEVRPIVEAWQAKFLQENPDAAADSANLRIGYTGKPSFIAEVASGMEGDMRGSMTFTSIFICILFWLIHRRLVPLVWLFSLLMLIVGITLLIGSTVFGQLSVMSIGFAAILLGLVVDYGVVLYKEADVAPGDPQALRRIIGPSVLWAALTTGAVFFALHFSSLPGVAQLGTLVTTGVIVGGIIMLVFYSPVAAHYGAKDSPGKNSPSSPIANDYRKGDRTAALVTTALVLACLATLLSTGLPEMATDFRPMRLRNSPSMEAYDSAKQKLHGLDDESNPIIITASDPAQLAERVAVAQQHMQEQLDAGKIASYSLPVAVVPNPKQQQQNRATLTKLIRDQPRLLTAIDDAGFSEDAAGLAKGVFANWQKFLDATPADGKSFALPEHLIGRWVIDRFVSFAAETGVGATTAGLDHPIGQPEVAATGQITAPAEVINSHPELRKWAAQLSRPEQGIRVSSWSTLTVAIHELIRADFVRVFLPMALILAVMLVVVFRNLVDALLTLSTLTFSGVLLVVATQWFGFSWNFFNITAVPILFGTAVDYSIHMIFALRRSNGDLRAVRRGISKAILFCAGSTAVGFGSLSIAANQGLSSLGQICGLGILTNMLAALLLLPHWWRLAHKKSR
jgi:predicted RND superfamily exporter protein